MNTPAATESDQAGLSVYEEAERAVQEHKWLESEKAGRDLGHEAVQHWSRRHWLRFYRWRFVQHLCGEVYFREFHQRTFAIVSCHLKASPELLEAILNQVRDGAENLDIICWAQNSGLPIESVIDILKAIDINRQRLRSPSD